MGRGTMVADGRRPARRGEAAHPDDLAHHDAAASLFGWRGIAALKSVYEMFKEARETFKTHQTQDY